MAGGGGAERPGAGGLLPPSLRQHRRRVSPGDTPRGVRAAWGRGALPGSSLTPIPVAGEPREAVGVQQAVLRRRGSSVPDHGLRPRLLPPDLPPGRGAGTAALGLGWGAGLALGLGVPELLCPGDGAWQCPEPRGMRVSPGPVPRVLLPCGRSVFGVPTGWWWLSWGGTGPVLQTRSVPGRCGTLKEENRGRRGRGFPCAGFWDSALSCGNSLWKERGTGSLKSL